MANQANGSGSGSGSGRCCCCCGDGGGGNNVLNAKKQKPVKGRKVELKISYKEQVGRSVGGWLQEWIKKERCGGDVKSSVSSVQ